MKGKRRNATKLNSPSKTLNLLRFATTPHSVPGQFSAAFDNSSPKRLFEVSSIDPSEVRDVVGARRERDGVALLVDVGVMDRCFGGLDEEEVEGN